MEVGIVELLFVPKLFANFSMFSKICSRINVVYKRT